MEKFRKMNPHITMAQHQMRYILFVPMCLFVILVGWMTLVTPNTFLFAEESTAKPTSPSLVSLPSAATPLNVVLIISDDQHHGDYGFMGHPSVSTPRIDKLASEGVVFTRGYVPSSLCCPSLAAMITGLFPHQNRITCNDPPNPQNIPRPQFHQSDDFLNGREIMAESMRAVPTLPRLLQQQGYISLQTGKWWQGDYRSGGFTHGMSQGGRHGDAGLAIGRKTMKPIRDFLDTAAQEHKPFFMWYAPMLPHDPHDPAAELVEKYQKKTDSLQQARYWGNIERFDQTCGELLDELDSRNLSDSTLVVYVCDNGWIQNPSGPSFMPRSKRSPYEGGVRTPIIFRLPGKIRPLMDTSHLASSTDIAPTILAALGLSKSPDMRGINLLDEDQINLRHEIFGECYTHDALNLVDVRQNLQHLWMIRDQWKLILPQKNAPDDVPELFNVIHDPKETKNLIKEHPQIAAEMTAALEKFYTPSQPQKQPSSPLRSQLPKPSPKHPNVLMIVVDDMGFSDLGCYGGEIDTPNLDTLAAGGLRFTQFYNTARCWPTRTAMLTGYYPQQVRSDPVKRGAGFPAGTMLLPHHLATLGYQSYQSGKWHVVQANSPIKDGGFHHSYELLDHDRNFYPKRHLLDDVPLPPVDPNGSYYTTIDIAEHTISQLKRHAEETPNSPFFALTAFTVPHFPLHAPQPLIDKYRAKYRIGWDAVRQTRYSNLIEKGIVRCALSPREEEVGPPYTNNNLAPLGQGEVLRPVAWNTLTQVQQEFQATKMAIHAAMVDCMDQQVGRILDQLRQMKVLDDTLILFFSDNGCSAELMIRGDGHDPTAPMGSAESYLCLGPGWSTASNTPFRRHKVWTLEGGVSTPLLVHWPNGIAAKGGELRHDVGHVVDIVPTILDVLDLQQPEMWNGTKPALLSGVSLLPAICEGKPVSREYVYFSHEQNDAIRIGDWKAIRIAKTRQGDGEWRLYDMKTDRCEQTDMADQYSAKLAEMVSLWNQKTQNFAESAE